MFLWGEQINKFWLLQWWRKSTQFVAREFLAREKTEQLQFISQVI